MFRSLRRALCVAVAAFLRFERRSCGDGAKGERFYDWALAEASWPSAAGSPRRGWSHLLLVRRSLSDPSEVAYFIVHARIGSTLPTLVKTAGLRWAVEDCFETTKSDCGLDRYEVRKGNRGTDTSPWLVPPSLLSVSATRTARLAPPNAGTAATDGTEAQPAIAWQPLTTNPTPSH
ncbi:hypothetical protein ACFP51_09025 [Streptomyces pratens]|uniref:Transposase IS4-like domain-containing protein n=1 Tax=Streptomyces pratens TaxID=887456 RepID=A0ABW1LZ64_9ACTN